MPDPRAVPVAALLRLMVDALIDHTEAVTIASVDDEDCTTFSVASDPRDTASS